MTLPTIPETHHVYVGADMQPLHLYTLEQMLQLRAETVKACAAMCDEGHELQNSSFQGLAIKIRELLI